MKLVSSKCRACTCVRARTECNAQEPAAAMAHNPSATGATCASVGSLSTEKCEGINVRSTGRRKSIDNDYVIACSESYREDRPQPTRTAVITARDKRTQQAQASCLTINVEVSACVIREDDDI